ncbi:protein SDA1 [Nematocida ausubeli]|nr:protein SDA1 [Nematocida ausubeli]
MDIRLQLQIKRDPKSFTSLYKNEVEKLKGMIKISKLDPQAKNKELASLLTFLPHISKHFSEDISTEIFNFALDYYTLLNKAISQAVITAISTLKKTKQLGPEIFYKQAIPLIESMDKRTKTTFLQFLIAEIIRDVEYKEIIQNILKNTVKSGVEMHSKRAAYIYMHLISRNTWTDEKSTEIVFKIIEFAPETVIKFILRYLLDRVQLVITEEEVDMPSRKTDLKIKRETKADKKRNERKEKLILKKLAEKKEKELEKLPNIVILINRIKNAPEITAKLFKLVKKSTYSSEVKLLLVQVISRMIAYCKITVKGFMSYMMRFLFPHENELPTVFATISQAIHENTLEKEVEAVCDLIVENFCSDFRDDEVIAYGINSLRMIIRRFPKAVAYASIGRVITGYKKMNKRKAQTAASALKKMVREINERGNDLDDEITELESDYATDEEITTNGNDTPKEDISPNSNNNDYFSTQSENEGYSSESETESNGFENETDDDSNGFVTEEMIGKIRRKATREEKIAKAKAEKREKKEREHTGTNKEKQKTTNYTVRKTKRMIIPKKKSKKK